VIYDVTHYKDFGIFVSSVRPITTFRIKSLYDDGGFRFIEDSPISLTSFYINLGPEDMTRYRIGDIYDLVPRPKE
jgi:hypothetical protein